MWRQPYWFLNKIHAAGSKSQQLVIKKEMSVIHLSLFSGDVIYSSSLLPSLWSWTLFPAFVAAVGRLLHRTHLLSFSAGNSKQALRCKTCKIAAHLWCTSELSQQLCHGKVQMSVSFLCFTVMRIQKITVLVFGGRTRWGLWTMLSEWVSCGYLGSRF